MEERIPSPSEATANETSFEVVVKYSVGILDLYTEALDNPRPVPPELDSTAIVLGHQAFWNFRE